MHGSPPDISIITVSYNSAADLGPLLQTIRTVDSRITREVIIVDNASEPETHRFLKPLENEFHIVYSCKNLGFAGANNLGINAATGRYLLLLNPDTLLHPGALAGMVEFMDEHPGVGACGPRLLNPDGSLQRSARRFPGLLDEIFEMTYLSSLRSRSRFFNHYQIGGWDHNSTRRVDFVVGACVCIRPPALAAVGGGLDDGFFMFYEESDLMHRMSRSGWATWFLNDPLVTHFGGTTYGGRTPKLNLKLYDHRMNSRYRYYRKWGTWFHETALDAAFLTTGWLRKFVFGVLKWVMPGKRRSIEFLIAKANAEVRYALHRTCQLDRDSGR